MSLLDDYEILQELSKNLGNEFRAVQYVSKVARKFAERYDNIPLHSEALSYAIRGEIPASLKGLISNGITVDYFHLYLREAISHIDDKDIRDAVYSSITESKRTQNLTYNYRGIQNKDKQARIRIITNMLWYEFTLKLSGGKYNE